MANSRRSGEIVVEATAPLADGAAVPVQPQAVNVNEAELTLDVDKLVQPYIDFVIKSNIPAPEEKLPRFPAFASTLISIPQDQRPLLPQFPSTIPGVLLQTINGTSNGVTLISAPASILGLSLLTLPVALPIAVVGLGVAIFWGVRAYRAQKKLNEEEMTVARLHASAQESLALSVERQIQDLLAMEAETKAQLEALLGEGGHVDVALLVKRGKLILDSLAALQKTVSERGFVLPEDTITRLSEIEAEIEASDYMRVVDVPTDVALAADAPTAESVLTVNHASSGTVTKETKAASVITSAEAVLTVISIVATIGLAASMATPLGWAIAAIGVAVGIAVGIAAISNKIQKNKQRARIETHKTAMQEIDNEKQALTHLNEKVSKFSNQFARKTKTSNEPVAGPANYRVSSAFILKEMSPLPRPMKLKEKADVDELDKMVATAEVRLALAKARETSLMTEAASGHSHDMSGGARENYLTELEERVVATEARLEQMEKREVSAWSSATKALKYSSDTKERITELERYRHQLEASIRDLELKSQLKGIFEEVSVEGSSSTASKVSTASAANMSRRFVR